MISAPSNSSFPLYRAAVWICLRTLRPYLLALPLLLALVTDVSAQTDGFTALHQSTGVYASYHPIIGSDGNFYGADANTQVIYKLTPAGDYTVLYNFAGTSLGGPSSELLLANDGDFYGIAFQSYGNSVVYRLTPDGNLSTVHVFANPQVEGRSTYSRLVQGTDGNFYGTAEYGGSSDSGTIFKLTPDGLLTVLYNFPLENNGTSLANLVRGNDGNFYGTTRYGGAYQAGSAFSVTPAGVFTNLHSFGNDDDRYPDDLVLGKDGAFYGCAGGTIYSVTTAGVYSPLYTFSNPNGNTIKPTGRLLSADDGTLYGATAGLGGALFKLTTDGTLTYLYHFPYGYTGNNQSPVGDLLRDAAGNLYGISTGIPDNTFFKLTPPPSVSLSAPVPTVTGGTGQVGEFQLTLSTPVAYDVMVSCAIKGSAESNIVKIKAGKTRKVIKVEPPTDYSSGFPKVVVKLILQTGDGYILGDSTKAKVKIFFPSNQ